MNQEKLRMNINVDEEEIETPIRPYNRLLASVLYRAIVDLGKRKHRHRALSWIKSERTAEYPQSFAWFCDALKIDPNRFRNKLLNLQP